MSGDWSSDVCSSDLKVLRDPWCSLWHKQPSAKPVDESKYRICVICGKHLYENDIHSHKSHKIEPEPQIMTCPAGYPNCAFCDIKEPHPHNKCCDIDCLNGKTCVPYVPEKWVDVTYEHLREKLGKYKYGLR